jgi:hypothetical protein
LAFTGGHGGINYTFAGYGGNAGNGGGGGLNSTNGVAGVSGSGGNGGNGIDGGGGAGGSVGTMMMVNSTVTTAIAGSNGIAGSYGTNGGGGGGGGGDGIYASNGITVTNQSVITGGGGGNGANSGAQGGGGGGAGSGVGGNGFTIINSGSITGGTGGQQGSDGPSGTGGNGGGGHGVVGANLTITNAGTISGGTCAGGCEKFAGNTAGDAILFTTGTNALNLLTGSTISGNIELGNGAYSYIQAQDSGLVVSSGIVLDDATTEVGFNTTHASLTVSGVISGGGSLNVSGPASGAYRLILTGANTFTGGATVLSSNLQVDGSLYDATVAGGVLVGTGSLVNVTVGSSGTIAPGESSQMYGTLTVNDRANLSSGSTLTIHTSNGSTCSSIHTNTLALGGTLQIRFEDAPKIGASCTLATANSVTGTFTQAIAGPATVAVSYAPPNITFTVIGSDDIFASGFEQ